MTFSGPIADAHLLIASTLTCLTSVFFSESHRNIGLSNIGAYVFAALPSAIAKSPTNSRKPFDTLLFESAILTLSRPTSSPSPFGNILILDLF